MKSSYQSLLCDLCLVAFVASAVMFTNLGTARLWDRDEPRNAGCAAEMMARGDWVIPVFGGELRDHKPVLLYWLIMSAYHVFGVSEFAARFWSAVLGVGTSLCTYWIGRRLFTARVGLWAGIILSTTLMFDVAARAATPDSALIFFSTAAITVFVVTTFRPAASTGASEAKGTSVRCQYFPSSWTAAAAIYALMGLGVLAKGPVGLVLPTAVIGMFLLIQRLPGPAESTPSSKEAHHPNRYRRLITGLIRGLNGLLRPFAPAHFLKTSWAMRPITAIIAVSIIAVPWYAWVGWRTDGEFLRGFFLVHNVGRAVSSMEGHAGPIIYYPVAILVGFFPWSVFIGGMLIGAIARVRRHDPWQIGYVLALCWVGVYVGLFSLASTKLPSYVTPCYPALALLAGAFMYHWSRGEAIAAPIWPRLSFVSLAAVGVVLIVALPLVAQRYLPGEQSLAALGVIPLLGAVVCLALTQRGYRRPAASAMAVTAFLFCWTMFGWATVRLDKHQLNHQMLQAIERMGPEVEVGAFECLEPTWIFYGGRPIRTLATTTDHLPATRSPAAQNWRPRAATTPAEFFRDGHKQVVITTRAKFQRHRALFPPRAAIMLQSPYFLKKDPLVLIAVAEDHSAAVARQPRIGAQENR